MDPLRGGPAALWTSVDNAGVSGGKSTTEERPFLPAIAGRTSSRFGVINRFPHTYYDD